MSTLGVPLAVGRTQRMVRKKRADKNADSGYLIESIEYVSPTSLPLNTKLHQREARERLLARTRQRIKDRFESLPDETETV